MILMLSLVPFLILLAAAPATTPTEAPHVTPLTEIGRVRSTPICTPIVVHANGAITSALDNDRSLGILTTNLRATNFDRMSSIQLHNTIEEMMKQAGGIRQNGKLADNEIKQLRAYAAASTDPERKAELKTFADALGGAIYRQTKAAAEFMRDVTIMQGREEAQEVRDIRAHDDNVVEPPTQRTQTPRALLPAGPKSYNQAMREMAGELSDRVQAIGADEGIAAEHSIAATSGC